MIFHAFLDALDGLYDAIRDLSAALALAIPARTPMGRRPKSTHCAADTRGWSPRLSWYPSGFL